MSAERSNERHQSKRPKLRALVFTAAVLAATTSVLAAPQPANAHASTTLAERLKSAPVPSLCGHPAGRLVNGTLPGIAPGQGEVSLGNPARIRTGRVKGFGKVVVAVVDCNQGGVAWPQNFVLWTPKLKVITGRSLMDFTHGGREYVHGLRIRRGKLTINVAGITAEDEPFCCGTGMARITARGKNGRLKASTQHFRERTAARSFVKHVNNRRWVKARKLGTSGAVTFFKARRSQGRMSVATCFSNPNPPEPGIARSCYVTFGDGTAGLLNLSVPKFGRWRVVSGQW